MKAADRAWKEVRLGDVLRYIDERVSLDDGVEYLTITVKRRHGGLEIRERVFGSQIATKKQFRLVPGAFIISRVQCWHQAYAVVGDVPANAIASTNYDQFSIAPEVDARFFWWLSHTPAFTDTVRSSAVGVVIEKMVFNRERWLSKSVRVPALTTQQRIVRTIEELARHVTEARTLRQVASEETAQILPAEELRLWPNASLGDARALERVTAFLARGRQSEQGESEHYLIKTQHVQRGHYIPTTLRLAAHAARKVQSNATVRDGDILIACSAAGCLGRVARYRHDGRTASTDTHVAIARADPNVVDPDYLYSYLRGAQGQHQLRSRERGDWLREKVHFRLTELNMNELRQVPIPLPPLPEQRRIVAYLEGLRRELETLKECQGNSAGDIDSLLPAIIDRAFEEGV